MYLNADTLLANGRYRIEKVLGHGGFGITYLGEHTALGYKVAIKEFFMGDFCERDESTSQVSLGTKGSRDMVDRFRQKFLKEARCMATLEHKGIVSVIDVFEENGTVYYIMPFLTGGSLAEKVSGGALSENAALQYIREVADALAYLHSLKIMHLDVKPGNIMLDSNNNAVLVDFGLAKQYDGSGIQQSSTPVGVSAGYAPLEQSRRGGVEAFSPATDIYSLGATLYKLITGKTPPEAYDVNDRGLPPLPNSVSPAVSAAIKAAMQPRCKERPQSITEFLALLDGVSAESFGITAPVTVRDDLVEPLQSNDSRSDGDVESSSNSQDKKKSRVALWFFFSLLLIVVGGACAWMLMGDKKEETAASGGSETVQQTDADVAPKLREKGLEAYIDNNYEKAAQLWQQASELGDAESCLFLGECFYNGYGVEISMEKALELWHQAADLGSVDACFNLGVCYSNGYGTDVSMKKAFGFYERAAEAGNKDAKFLVALCYFGGEGVYKSYDAAVSIFRELALDGYADAQYYMGVCYENGYGVPVSYEDAMEWYLSAESNGAENASEAIDNLKENVRNEELYSNDDITLGDILIDAIFQ